MMHTMFGFIFFGQIHYKKRFGKEEHQIFDCVLGLFRKTKKTTTQTQQKEKCRETSKNICEISRNVP